MATVESDGGWGNAGMVGGPSGDGHGRRWGLWGFRGARIMPRSDPADGMPEPADGFGALTPMARVAGGRARTQPAASPPGEDQGWTHGFSLCELPADA